MLGGFYVPWGDVATDVYGFFYYQSSQFQNRLSTRATAVY